MPALDAITPLVLTWNEAPNIARCLDRLRWAREVVVLDSLSTDGTQDIARSFPNTRLIERPFDNHTAQWNAGLGAIASPYILSLDADYILEPNFGAEIATLPPGPVAWFARFRYCIGGHPLPGSLYPPRAVLFNRKHCRYREDWHTQMLAFDGPSAFLRSRILHDDRKPLDRWLETQLNYCRLEAKKIFETPAHRLPASDAIRKAGWIAPWLVPIACHIGLGLWRRGLPRLAYTLQRALHETLLALILADLRADASAPVPGAETKTAQWVRAQTRHAAERVDKLLNPDSSKPSVQDRLRLMLWPAAPAVAAHLLLARGLLFRGLPGLRYALQRTYAELALSVTLADRRLAHGPAPR